MTTTYLIRKYQDGRCVVWVLGDVRICVDGDVTRRQHRSMNRRALAIHLFWMLDSDWASTLSVHPELNLDTVPPAHMRCIHVYGKGQGYDRHLLIGQKAGVACVAIKLSLLSAFLAFHPWLGLRNSA